MKRLSICLLALVMFFQAAACSAAAEGSGYSDVASGAWYAEAAEYCRARGLMSGVGDNRFVPEGALTRAALAVVLYRIEGEPAVNGPDAFTDTQDGVWYSDAVLWASQKELMGGYGGGLFGPGDPLTREQMTAVLWRCAGSPTAEESSYSDAAEISDYAVTAAAWAHANGLVRPISGDVFAPRATATRGQAADLLMRYDRMEKPAPEQPASGEGANVLIACFSATGSTRGVANHIKDILGNGADLYEIVPEVPYTSADLNYGSDSSRANREQRDDGARPAISGGVENMEQYDVVFLGYPIWWGKAPKIIHTFLERYDFSGKIIVPFCTSGSSPCDDSTITPLAAGAEWRTGARFPGGAPRSAVESWVSSLDLPQAGVAAAGNMYLQIGDRVWTAALEDNPSVTAWKELLAQGPLTVDMHDYGGFEKVGGIGTTLPQSSRQITARPGDIILYQGSSVTIYYGENSWNFTPLGHIGGVTDAELRQVLKAGGENVRVTFSLEEPTGAPALESAAGQ